LRRLLLAADEHPNGAEMEIARSAAGVACSKEHQRIYAEWFALADPGTALSFSRTQVPSRGPWSLRLTATVGGALL
jgi:hypothetical protein